MPVAVIYQNDKTFPIIKLNCLPLIIVSQSTGCSFNWHNAAAHICRPKCQRHKFSPLTANSRQNIIIHVTIKYTKN